MTKQSLLFIGALALSTVAFAGPKSYDIVLFAPTQAGSNQLAAGEYHVQVQGSNAIFTNVDTRHSFVAPVKVATTLKHEPPPSRPRPTRAARTSLPSTSAAPTKPSSSANSSPNGFSNGRGMPPRCLSRPWHLLFPTQKICRP